MGIGVAIVICVAIISACSMVTVLGVAGMKYGDKYIKDCKNKKNESKK